MVVRIKKIILIQHFQLRIGYLSQTDTGKVQQKQQNHYFEMLVLSKDHLIQTFCSYALDGIAYKMFTEKQTIT